MRRTILAMSCCALVACAGPAVRPSHPRIFRYQVTSADEATAYYRGARQALVGFQVEKGGEEPVRFSTRHDSISQCGIDGYIWSMRASYRADGKEAQLALRPCVVSRPWSFWTALTGREGESDDEDNVCSFFDIPVGEYRAAREKCVEMITAKIAEDWKKRSEKLLSEMRSAPEPDLTSARAP
jgi:hypothetical protein